MMELVSGRSNFDPRLPLDVAYLLDWVCLKFVHLQGVRSFLLWLSQALTETVAFE